MTEKDRAIELARRVLRDKNLGVALVPSESMLLAEQYLRELRLIDHVPESDKIRSTESA